MTVKAAAPADIPTVDLALLVGTPEEQKAAFKLLDHAFSTCGFVYISNHGIPQALLDEAWNYVSPMTVYTEFSCTMPS